MVKPDRSLHICLLGDSGIGQSSLLRAYRGEEQPEDSGGGSQLESFITDVDVEGDIHRVRFTDSAGGEIYDSVRKPILSTAHCMLMCFAIDTPSTMASLASKWLPLLKSIHLGAPVIILGLRADLRKKGKACMPAKDAEIFADEHGAVGYIECSVTQPESVTEVFHKALLTAREYYGLRWQRGMQARRVQAEDVQDLGGSSGAKEAAAEESYLAETVLAVDDTTPLTREMATKALSVLGVSPERRHAYLRVDVGGMGLTTVDALRGFPHLQFVNVSENRLRSLEPLGALRHLLHLNASLNLISRTQGFAPPNQLETVDLSYNMISDLGDWGVHKFLRELNLRGNFIQRIGKGLLQSRMLMMLDLSENQVSKVENLDGLELRTLYLAQNQLTSIEGISGLKKLQVLNIRHNELSSLSALRSEDIPRLRKLCVSENQIAHIREVEWLESFSYLCDLFLAPNPIMELPYYRAQVLNRLPRLRWLDDEAVTAEEKVKASIMYGADVQKRQSIFEQLLPAENFIDRRLVTEEMIAQMEEEKFGQRGGFIVDGEGEAEEEGRAAAAAAEDELLEEDQPAGDLGDQPAPEGAEAADMGDDDPGSPGVPPPEEPASPTSPK